MQMYIYKLTLNEKYQDLSAWNEGVQAKLGAHAQYLQELASEGWALVVGRTDTDLKSNFGVVIFLAQDQAEAEKIMNNDPVIKGGVMSAQLFPFKLLKVTPEAVNWNVW